MKRCVLCVNKSVNNLLDICTAKLTLFELSVLAFPQLSLKRR